MQWIRVLEIDKTLEFLVVFCEIDDEPLPKQTIDENAAKSKFTHFIQSIVKMYTINNSNGF